MTKNDSVTIDFNTLIGLDNIQAIQDSFSDAMGIASVITKPDGTPITRPSNFSCICSLIRTTKKGRENCMRSDAAIGQQDGESMHHLCLSAGLCDGAANIYIGKQKVAVWLIGQIITEDVDEDKIIQYTEELGINREEAIAALSKSTKMPLDRFKKITHSLAVFANQLSKNAYQNTQLLMHQENLESIVKEKTYDLEDAFHRLSVKNAELTQKNELIEMRNQDLKNTLKELKDAESQLVQAEKMASLGILTAGVAHEINNPLNFISGSYLALEKIVSQGNIDINKEKIKLLLNSLKVGVERTSSIVSSLNQFSRKNTSYNEKCDLHSIIENCLVMLINQTKYKVNIYKEYAQSEALVTGNQGNLHQVFLNIISNAAQAITKSGKISISTKQDHTNVVVEIEDNGIGISPKNLKKVMDPFYTTKAPGKGTGLGLSISHNIIKDHKGKLKISSERGVGTLVSITLPLYQASKNKVS